MNSRLSIAAVASAVFGALPAWLPAWLSVSLAAWLSVSLSAALAVVLPTECVGCGVRDHPLCPDCAETIGPAPGGGRRSVELLVDASLVDSSGGPPLRVWAGVPYGGVVSASLSAFKESGRTDAARALARVLEPAVLDARAALRGRLPAGARLELTPAPSSRAAFRRRGYHPVMLLVGHARGQLHASQLLTVARATADQAGLGVDARNANLSGSLMVRSRLPGALAGRHFLVVDDVVTTGSTLAECRRALEAAGATVWGAVTLAYTPRLHGTSAVRLAHEPAVS